MSSLANELSKSWETSQFQEHSNQRFIPADEIRRLTSEENMLTVLGDINRDLALYISQYAKKVFLTTFRLLWVDEKQGLDVIIQSMNDFKLKGLKDNELPISGTVTERRWPKENIEHLWGSFKVTDFIDTFQWMFLAPVLRKGEEDYARPDFHVGNRKYDIPGKCIMPFVKDSGEMGEDTRETNFSVVRKAQICAGHCERESKEVAIKRIKLRATQHGTHPDDAQWHAEARTLAAIQSQDPHRNIINCLAAIKYGDKRYFIFPWADGGSLRDFWTRTPKQLPDKGVVEHAVRELFHLTDALLYLHNFRPTDTGTGGEEDDLDAQGPKVSIQDEEGNEQPTTEARPGIRHGDLKPENILLFDVKSSGTNGLGTLKIADMGLAKQHLQATEHRQAVTNTSYGTITYESPEAHPTLTQSTTGSPTARSRLYDVWSMGCIVLEYIIWMLYGSEGLQNFISQLRPAPAGTGEQICQFYRIVDGETMVHPVVSHWIKHIEDHDPECSQQSAIKDLLNLVKSRLLVVHLPPVDTTDDDLRYRTKAQYLRKSLDDMVRQLSNAGYITTGKPRQSVQLPSDDQGGAASLGQSLLAEPDNQSTRRDYAVPPLAEWEFPVDNDFAHYVQEQLGKSNLETYLPSAKLCENCSQLKIFEDDSSWIVSVSVLEGRSQVCDFCKMLARLVANALKDSHLPAPARDEQVSFTRKGTTLLLDGVAKLPVVTIFRSPDLETPNDCIQLGLPRPPQPNEDFYYKLLDLWLKDCDLHHDFCDKNPANQTFWPTRLIDLGTTDEPKLRLINTSEEAVRGKHYVAVSHQWGKTPEHPPFVTTMKNVQKFSSQDGIPEGGIPATLRDAVKVTRKLSIKYLWIDTICIIQGKDGDFKSEAQRMEDVYNSAYFVLATSRTRGSNDSFLDGSRRQAECVKFQRDAHPFYMCEFIDDFNGDVLQSGLAKRGWVFQERALAKRTIFFAENQTYFECGQGIRCSNLSKMHSTMVDFLGDPNFPEKAMMSNRGVKIRFFQDLYRTYSRLQFSQVSDRPFAIAGLDNRLRKAYNTQGNWGIFDDGVGKGLLHRSLLWRRGDEEELDPGLVCFEMPADRQTDVPSWSWMGRKGAIDYLDPPFEQTEWATDIVTPWTAKADELKAGDGPGSSSHISSRRPALIATCHDCEFPEDPEGKVHITFDDQRSKAEGTALLKCLVVAKVKSSQGDNRTDAEKVHYVLIIAPTMVSSQHSQASPGQGSYKRIGAGSALGRFISREGKRVKVE